VTGSLIGARIPALATLLLVVVVVATACTNQPSAIATPDLASPAQGVIVAVEATSLSDVRGFTLRTAGGFAFELRLGILENATAFPPGHLAEHQATSAPVLVWFRVENGERVAYRLEDALPSAPPGASPAPAAT
jgi:hypothetical protein